MWATILIFLTFLQKQCIYLWRRAPLPPGYIGCSHPQPFATFPNISSVNPPSPTQPFPLTVHVVHLFTKGDPFRSPIGAEDFSTIFEASGDYPTNPISFFASFHGPQNGQGRNQENYTRYTTLKPLALHFENFERTYTQPLNLWLCSSKMEKSGSRPISSAG